MNDLVLTLAVRWLPAVDVFAASCVSHEWQTILSADQDNGELWKQVCKNSYPLVTAKIQQQHPVDFRSLALGLLDPDTRTTRPRMSAQSSRTVATLRPEDLFAVVDLYRIPLGTDGKRQRQIVGSWICSVSDDGTIDTRGSGQDEVVLKGENPYSASNRDSEEVEAWKARATRRQTMPHEFAVWDLFGASWLGGLSLSLGVRVTLFRRTDMKCVCLMDELEWTWPTRHPRVVPLGDFHVRYQSGGTLRYQIKFADNDAGCKAKAMMYDHDFSILEMNAVLSANEKMAQTRTEGEAPWLANCLRAFAVHRDYYPDRDDQVALSHISHFEFEINLRFTLQLYSHTNEVTFDFPYNGDIMVALDGLRWK